MEFEKSDKISGLEKSALLLNILGNQVTAQVFKCMKDYDIRELLKVMSQVKKVPIDLVKNVLLEFYTEISEADNIIFDHAHGKDFFLSTLGEDRAKTVLGELSVLGESRTLEALDMVDAQTIANFLVNEHPQTLALILAHLEPVKKAEVLKMFPEKLQAEVVLRMANLDFISPDLILEIDEILKLELSAINSLNTRQLGGVKPLAEMLNVMDSLSEKALLSQVEEKDPQLVEKIKKIVFLFEDIIYIDDRGVQLFLSEVPNDKLVIALKSAPVEIKEKIFKNISKNAVVLLKSDLEKMGALKLADIEQAQKEIVDIIKKLKREGKINILNRI